MILNEKQKKEVISLVTEGIKRCKEEGKDPMFLIDDVERSAKWSINWRYEWDELKPYQDDFVEYGYSVMDDIIKEVYGSSRIDFHLNKMTDGNRKIFKNVTE